MGRPILWLSGFGEGAYAVGLERQGCDCEAWAEDLVRRVEVVGLGLPCLRFRACVAGLALRAVAAELCLRVLDQVLALLGCSCDFGSVAAAT